MWSAFHEAMTTGYHTAFETEITHQACWPLILGAVHILRHTDFGFFGRTPLPLFPMIFIDLILCVLLLKYCWKKKLYGQI